MDAGKRRKMDGERPSTTTSAAAISLNDDVLMEVLLLLPAKSLIRFKSVCKHWHSLISDPSLSHRHTLRHRKPKTAFLLRVSPSEFFYFSPKSKKFIPFHLNFAQAKIRQSCHGLLLLECGYTHKDYYVYNPSTGESRNLLPKKGHFLGLHLAFDPSISPHYKVVCLKTTSYSIHRFEVEVYDSETHTWKRDEKVYSNPPPLLYDGVYWKNCIYSLTSDGRVYCFDIEKAMFRMPPLDIFGIRPQTGGLCMFYIMESGGHVHYIAHDDVMNLFMVYEITEKGCDLSLKYLFDFGFIRVSLGARTHGKVCLIGTITGEREEEYSLVFHVPGKIMAFRFYDRRFEELLDLRGHKFYREGCLQFGYHDAYQFIESLAPV